MAASAAAGKNEVLNLGSGGKDTVIIATKEDHDTPSTIKLVDKPDDREPGPILPNGEINWGCPCLGSMASGPCAVEFREAFSCFHYSKAEPKGSDCMDAFMGMQKCLQSYPELYKDEDGAVDVDQEEDDGKSPQRKPS